MTVGPRTYVADLLRCVGGSLHSESLLTPGAPDYPITYGGADRLLASRRPAPPRRAVPVRREGRRVLAAAACRRRAASSSSPATTGAGTASGPSRASPRPRRSRNGSERDEAGRAGRHAFRFRRRPPRRAAGSRRARAYRDSRPDLPRDPERRQHGTPRKGPGRERVDSRREPLADGAARLLSGRDRRPREDRGGEPGGKSAAPPAQHDVGTRYATAGPQTPLGNQVKLKKGRKEAEEKLSSASGTAKTGEAGLPERAEPGTRSDQAKAAKVVDRDGRGESYWRGRAKKLREDLSDAEAELKIATDDRDRYERTDPPPGEGATATWAFELQRRRDRVDRAQQRVDAAKRRLDELSEEARKADALPGWIR